MKLCLKLERNADWFLIDADKISYEILWLEENAAITINFFYWNNFLINLNILIKLLKMIYNDVSWKYTILTRLETYWQMNCEFISFYFKFLVLMKELNWNKNAKIIILWKIIFNKVWNQLINKNMLSIFIEFIVLC